MNYMQTKDLCLSYILVPSLFITRTDQDMIEFMLIPFVIVRNKGIAMETMKINIALMRFYGNILIPLSSH